jgi:transposase
MIAFPAGTKVWIAGGVTDMRRGMNTLALSVQQGLGRDPHAGEIFCFRGRKCRTSTTLSARDNHLGRFSGR